MILFFDLTEITTIAALVVLLVQGITHIGHLRLIKETNAHPLGVGLTVVSTLGIAGLMMVENLQKSPHILYSLLGMVGIALCIELFLRFKQQRSVKMQSHKSSNMIEEQ
jgi:hypothetical protein